MIDYGAYKPEIDGDEWLIEWCYVPQFDKVMFVCVDTSDREVDDHPRWCSSFYWGKQVDDDTIVYAEALIKKEFYTVPAPEQTNLKSMEDTMKTQEQLERLIPALDPTKLENAPDIFSLGMTQGIFKQAMELGYEFNDAELIEHNDAYDYILRAETIAPESIEFESSRLKTIIRIIKGDDKAITVMAGGITFDFDGAVAGDDFWWCDNVYVEGDVEAVFESSVFFWADWLEDFMEGMKTNGYEVGEWQLRFMLFSNGIAEDLTYI